MPRPNDLAHLRGLRSHLERSVLGQVEAVAGMADALIAGEMGHTRDGRPRSIQLLLGPTGTGKTKAVLAASAYLYGTGAVVRINSAEFSSEERVPLLLGRTDGEEGLLARKIADLRRRGGRILLLDEIEKAHPSVADYLLGIEEAAVMTAEMEGLARASVRRYVEQEASAHFRPEVLARFTAVLVFGHLPREVQVGICRQMVEEEIAFQSGTLSEKFGHPHRVRAGRDLYYRLLGEGWHRRLGARPMRNVVERRIRSALVEAQLRGALCPGVRESVLCVDTAGGVRATLARAPVVL